VLTVLLAGQHACSELPPTDTDDPVQHAVQLSFPTAFLYEPAAQGKHSRFSSGLKKKKCPATQLHSKTVALPGTETAFAGQALHAVLALAEYVSAGQSAHTVEPTPALYLPAAQAVHVLMSD
jgi:23S rRNA maturation-related 3'-5' exoribonuclease YhaM